MGSNPTRTLLVTATGEPVQPVRLTYDIADSFPVGARLRQVGCVAEESRGKRWQWLYQEETRGLIFGPIAYEQVPTQVQPVMIGRLSRPSKGKLVLEVRSVSRALAAARFFQPVLGDQALLRRGRIVNRYFDAAEMLGVPDGPAAIDRHLDQNVTVIDPEVTARELEAQLAGVKSPRELEERLARLAQERATSGADIPLVEDFPIYPEEETPDFVSLSGLLRFRDLRAYEHWVGRTERTLSSIIRDVVAGRFHPTPMPPQGPGRK